MKSNLSYDALTNRWVVEINGRECALHCGEILRISIGLHYIPCRLEMDTDWYICLSGGRFNLRHQEIYKVEM